MGSLAVTWIKRMIHRKDAKIISPASVLKKGFHRLLQAAVREIRLGSDLQKVYLS